MPSFRRLSTPTRRNPIREMSRPIVNSVEVTSEDSDPPDWLPDLSSLVELTVKKLGRDRWDIGVFLCSDSTIAGLNRQHRGRDEATDVLSFGREAGDESEVPDDVEEISGDIAISLESVIRNAEEFSVPELEETVRVLVHGVMHLAGYEHPGVKLTAESARDHAMLSLQEEIVTDLMKEKNG